MNEQIQDYIKTAREEHGMSDGQIRSNLLEAGWESAQVDAALVSSEQASIPKVTKTERQESPSESERQDQPDRQYAGTVAASDTAEQPMVWQALGYGGLSGLLALIVFSLLGGALGYVFLFAGVDHELVYGIARAVLAFLINVVSAYLLLRKVESKVIWVGALMATLVSAGLELFANTPSSAVSSVWLSVLAVIAAGQFAGTALVVILRKRS